MIDLERALTDLADHLDVPDTGDSAAALTRRLATLDVGAPPPLPRARPARGGRGDRRRESRSRCGRARPPRRRGLARHRGGRGPAHGRARLDDAVDNAVDRRTTATTRPSITPTNLAAARKAVQFEIATPHGAAAPVEVEVDHRVPGGLVALNYGHFTLDRDRDRHDAAATPRETGRWCGRSSRSPCTGTRACGSPRSIRSDTSTDPDVSERTRSDGQDR